MLKTGGEKGIEIFQNNLLGGLAKPNPNPMNNEKTLT